MTKIKHPVIKLVVLAVIVAGALIFIFREKFYCRPESVVQKAACGILGGEIISRTRAGEFVNYSAYGCFSKRRATDARKPCSRNGDCQGYCLPDSFIMSGPSGHCSEYRKSIPVCALRGSL